MSKRISLSSESKEPVVLKNTKLKEEPVVPSEKQLNALLEKFNKNK